MGKNQMTRREKEKIRHKNEILVQALKLFSNKGYHNVSMQEIAEASEFGVGTLYKFFESKDALFEELLNNCGENITSSLTALLDCPGTEKEHLSNFFSFLPDLLEKHAEFIKLYVSEVGIHGAKISKKRDKSSYNIILSAKLEQIINNGIKKGYFRKVDSMITAQAINSTLETIAFELADRFDKTEAIDIFEKVRHLFLDGLLLPGDKTND